jgi:hypothetical protein
MARTTAKPTPKARPKAARNPGRPCGYSPERVAPFLDLIAEAKSTIVGDDDEGSA